MRKVEINFIVGAELSEVKCLFGTRVVLVSFRHYCWIKRFHLRGTTPRDFLRV